MKPRPSLSEQLQKDALEASCRSAIEYGRIYRDGMQHLLTFNANHSLPTKLNLRVNLFSLKHDQYANIEHRILAMEYEFSQALERFKVSLNNAEKCGMTNVVRRYEKHRMKLKQIQKSIRKGSYAKKASPSDAFLKDTE